MENTAIIGMGMVGNAIRHVFSVKHWFDNKSSTATLKEIAEQRYIFICLPTNVKNGRYETDDISSIIKQIVGYGRQNVFIIKSTVNPGFAAHQMSILGINSIVSCPEFLTEKTWQKDIENPDFIAIGGAKKNYIDDVVGLHKARYKGVDIITSDNTTIEMVKWSINGFYALKVVYANQVYDYTQTLKANYETIKECMYKSKWIAKNHLEIFHQGGRGAGGKCLAKDLEAFSEVSNLPLLHQANGINRSYLTQSYKP